MIDLFWVALAGAGIVLLAPTGLFGISTLDPLGVALALLAGVFWGAYILLSARVGRAFPGVAGLALAMMVAALLLVPVGVIGAGAVLLNWHFLLIGRGGRAAFFGAAILAGTRSAASAAIAGVWRVDEPGAWDRRAGGRPLAARAARHARSRRYRAGLCGFRRRGALQQERSATAN